MDHPNDTEQNRLMRLLVKACRLHEAGDLKQAELLYLELIDRYPTIWQLYFNCGLLFFESGRYEKALEYYLKGVSLNSDSEDLLYNTAICQKELGLYEAAIASYRKALDLAPNDIDCLYNLAGCYRALDNELRAEEIYHTITERRPDHLPALNNLAYLTHKRGETGGAIKLYEKILAIDPDHVSADFMRAALSGESRTQSPDAYVRDVFDQYAAHYEHSLTARLHYDVPSNLYDLYLLHCPDHPLEHVLDLGCGTGLVGEKFASISRSLTGVDLSEKMLDEARPKNLYESLHHAEITYYLRNCPESSHDLVISADVLPYLGDLDELFRAVLSVLVETGHFLFSVEDHEGDDSSPVLRQSGRFAHSRKYVSGVAALTGWRIIGAATLDLRREREEWIQGAIYLMKPGDIS